MARRVDRRPPGPRGRPRRLGRLARSAASRCAIRSTKSRSPWSANTPSIATPTNRSTKRSTTPASPTRRQIRIQSIQSEAIEREGPERLLTGFDGMLVPGGFGERGIEGKVEAIRFARERGIPFFGICLGMQCAVIEFGRNVIGLAGAPFDRVQQRHAPSGDLPARRAEVDHRQRGHDAAGRPAGPPRSDQQSARPATARDTISERHRHRYEFNNVYRQQIRGPRHAGRRRRASIGRWSKSSSCPSIRGSWPCSSIPNSNRSRPRPIRCSPASSPPRSNATPPANGRAENVP